MIASVPVPRAGDNARPAKGTGRGRRGQAPQSPSGAGRREPDRTAEGRREAGAAQPGHAAQPEQAAQPGHAAQAEQAAQSEQTAQSQQAAEPRREVGARRRHLEGYRERPDLRVINGEGSGGEGSPSGRLRAVPPRETTGGRPGPQ